MKISIKNSDLLGAVDNIQGIAEKRSTLPIISHICISAKNDGVRLTATDLSLTAIAEIPAQVKSEGVITVIAHIFFDIIRKFSQQTNIEISQSETGISIIAEESRFHLTTMPSGDFPSVDKQEASHHFKITAKQGKKLFCDIAFSMGQEEARHYLNGVFMHHHEEENTLRCVTTDGHRLSMALMPAPRGAENMNDIIIPRKTVERIEKLVTKAEDKEIFEIATSSKTFQLKHKNKDRKTEIYSKLISANYPEYNRVIPVDNEQKMFIDAGICHQAIDRIAAISVIDKTYAIKLEIGEDKMKITSNAANCSAEETVKVKYAQNDLAISFNARYLLDITRKNTQNKLCFAFKSDSSPALIKAVDEPGILYVIMPMRM